MRFRHKCYLVHSASMLLLSVVACSEGSSLRDSAIFFSFLTILPLVLFVVVKWVLMAIVVLAHDLGGDSQDGMP